MKPLIIITGILSAILITVQAVLGLLIRSGGSPGVVVLVYVALSLSAILAQPRRPAP